MHRQTPLAPALAAGMILPFAPCPGQDDAAVTYVCPPCGSQCHTDDYGAPGACAMCGMTLVDASTVPRVAIYVFDGVELSNFAAPAGVFRHSNRVLMHTVADTTDEISSSEVLTITPRFSFDDAPAADVLIVVGGSNIREYAGDAMVTDWIAEAAEAADHVLCVGFGTLFLHPSGMLEGKRVPVPSFIAGNMDEFLPGCIAETEESVVTHGKVHLALDESGAVREALAIVADLAGDEVARQTAERMGFEFQAPAAPADDDE